MRSSSPIHTTPARRPSPWQIRTPLPVPSETIVRPTATTIDGARQQINAALNRGESAICPITGKLIRVYHRGLHQGQVSCLRRLARKSRQYHLTYIKIEDITTRRDGDFAKLVAWGLIEPRTPATKLEQESCRGWWKITDLGRRWLVGRCTVPRQMAFIGGAAIGPVKASGRIRAKDVPHQFKRKLLDTGRDGFHRQRRTSKSGAA